MASYIELRGRVRVNAPLADAFPFFTPEGERRWVPGWVPEYLHPPDGTLQEQLTFRTRHQANEVTLWLVSRLEASRGAIEYVRVTPDSRMGTVSVACEASGPGETTAWITYRLTALSPAGEAALDTFTREFPSMLASWQESINGKIVGAGFSRPMS